MATEKNITFGNKLEGIMSNLRKAILTEFEEYKRLFEETKAIMTQERWLTMTPEERQSVKADIAELEKYVKGLSELIEKHNIKTNINN